MIINKQQPVVNKLTVEEANWVYDLYQYLAGDNDLGLKNDPLELKQFQWMPDTDIYMLCYWYDDTFLKGTKPDEWKISRDSVQTEVYHKPKGVKYVIDNFNGDVFIDRKGLRSAIGTAAYAFQFHLKHHYAFPLFFGKGHWANGKNALQLGLAIPDRAPLYEALYTLFDNDKTLVNDWFSDKLFHGIMLNKVDVFNEELIEIKKQVMRKS